MRRRLRAVLSERHTDMPAGDYLFGARPEAATASHTELVVMVDHLLERIRRSVR